MTFEEKIKEIFAKEYHPELGWKKWKRNVLQEEHMKNIEKRVLALLPDYIIIRKQGDLHGEKALDAVIAWMHGKTVVDKQKLGEFEELLETRPKFYLYRCDEKDSFILALKEVDKHFELLEKKFRELKEK